MKTFKTQLGAALVAVSFTAPAAAQDSLPARAVSAIGIVIADQGNAALLQIRTELKETLLERIKPYLPQRPDVAPEDKPGKAPDSSR